MLAHSSGLLFAPNWANTGGISIISSSGQCSSLFCANPQNPIKPNGIALEPGGSFLLAHLGDTQGGVYRMSPTGMLSTVITHAGGMPLPPTNYVTTDAQGRIWVTVSTTIQPRSADYRASANTGFIAVAEAGETDARIVATGLGYTNECLIDFEQSAVFVNETFARRLSRFDLANDGSLSNRQTVTQFSNGTYPDGVTLDSEGNFWITSIVSNRIIKVSVHGEQTLIYEDSDSAFVQLAEQAYIENRMDTEHLCSTGNTTLRNTSSLAFAGPQRSTVFIGNLLGDCLHYFEADVPGRAPVHWDAPLGALEKFAEPN